jgi:methyl-accepting chemotaxis protein
MLDDMYNDSLLPSTYIASANLNAVYANRGLFRAVLADDKQEIEGQLSRVRERERAMNDFLAKFKASALSGQEKDILRKIDENWPKYSAVAGKVLALTVENRDDEAARLLNGEGLQAFQAVESLFKELVDINVGEGKIAFEDSTREYLRLRAILIGLLVCALATSLAIAISLARSLGGVLGRAQQFAQAVAGGDLGKTLEMRREDEVGMLARDLNRMVENLKAKIAEADQKSQEAARESENAAAAMREAQAAQAKAEEGHARMLDAAGRIQQVVEVVTSASEELSAQIEQSSRGSDEQSRRVTETATAMEEMNATVLEVAKNASQAAESSDKARRKAEDGADIVSRVVKGIAQVQEQAIALKGDMTTLGQQAQGIGQIMNVISDIADQTNLLALNAAIEAARAGEAGRGFAVVADEVRKLAEKTMVATKEVGDAIQGIQNGTSRNIQNVERSVQLIDGATEMAGQSGDALGEIVSLVEISSDQVRSIATASEEQSAASEEINRSIEDVNRISSETSDAMRQSAQAVGELAHQAQLLKNLVDELTSQNDEGGSARKALR